MVLSLLPRIHLPFSLIISVLRNIMVLTTLSKLASTSFLPPPLWACLSFPIALSTAEILLISLLVCHMPLCPSTATCNAISPCILLTTILHFLQQILMTQLICVRWVNDSLLDSRTAGTPVLLDVYAFQLPLTTLVWSSSLVKLFPIPVLTRVPLRLLLWLFLTIFLYWILYLWPLPSTVHAASAETFVRDFVAAICSIREGTKNSTMKIRCGAKQLVLSPIQSRKKKTKRKRDRETPTPIDIREIWTISGMEDRRISSSR